MPESRPATFKNMSLLTMVGLLAVVLSYIYPGYRFNNIPVYIPSLFSILFVPFIFRTYSKRNLTKLITFLSIFISIIVYNSIIGLFEFRDWLYITLPLGAIAATEMVAYVTEKIGVERLIKVALYCSLANLFLMIMQSVNLFNVLTSFSYIWENAISFVSYDEYQANILRETISIRPPGFFPTGIFSSTIIYISLRAHYSIYKKYIVFMPIIMAIFITANRTLAVFFVLFESYRLVAERGISRFFVIAALLVAFGSIVLIILIQLDVKLYVVQFIFDELMGGGLGTSDSVTGRLNTYDFFMYSFAKHWLLGGFSSEELAYYGGVFDSEFMLRILQFGIPGAFALAGAILLPRRSQVSVDWWFLPAIAFTASLTTTLVTGVIYTVVLAIYREAVLYRVAPTGA